MSKILNLLKSLYSKKINASGLAVFRVFYSVVLLCEVIQLYYFRHLIFDKIPFIVPAEIDFGYPLIIWMIVILFLIFGLFTRYTSILNYLFSLVLVGTIKTYEYHMFYVYMGVNFLLIFTSISKTGSIDALISKLKYSNTRFTYKPPECTSVLNYLIYPLAAIGFVYFDSVFFKLTSHNWMSGLGMWLPASLPQVTHMDASEILNQKWLILGLGYLTLAFEAIYIFTFFRKNWRVPLFFIGIGLHIGILIMFPIPWFGLGVMALYLLMVPVSWWNKLKKFLIFKEPRLIFYYDEECPLCKRTKIIITHLDFFNAIQFKGVQTYGVKDTRLKPYTEDELLRNIFSVTYKNKVLSGIDTYKKSLKYIPILFPLGFLISLPGFYHLAKAIYSKIAQNRLVERCTEENCGYNPPAFPVNKDEIKIFKNLKLIDIKVFAVGIGILLLTLLQMNVTYNSALINEVKSYNKINNTLIFENVQKVSNTVKWYSRIFFGITSHPVFMDTHFNNYNHIIAIEAVFKDGSKEWLPIINKDGQPDLFNYSFNWVKWTFRVNSPDINDKNLSEGIRDFTAFWAVKNNYKLDNIKFNVKVKKIKIPREWENDFLKKQLARPWIPGGFVEWKNKNFYSHILDIEKL